MKKTFERIKKVWIANEVKMVDHLERFESNLFDDIINYQEVIDDRMERIRKMNHKQCLYLLFADMFVPLHKIFSIGKG